MADVLTHFPEIRRPYKGRSQYSKYLDGRVWCVRLTDHPGAKTLQALQANIGTTARRRGVQVRTKQDTTDGCLYVQADLPRGLPLRVEPD